MELSEVGSHSAGRSRRLHKKGKIPGFSPRAHRAWPAAPRGTCRPTRSRTSPWRSSPTPKSWKNPAPGSGNGPDPPLESPRSQKTPAGPKKPLVDPEKPPVDPAKPRGSKKKDKTPVDPKKTLVDPLKSGIWGGKTGFRWEKSDWGGKSGIWGGKSGIWVEKLGFGAGKAGFGWKERDSGWKKWDLEWKKQDLGGKRRIRGGKSGIGGGKSGIRVRNALEIPAFPPFLLDVEEGDGIRVPQEQIPGAGVENLVAVGHRNLLGDLVLEVLDQDLPREEETPEFRDPNPPEPIPISRFSQAFFPGSAPPQELIPIIPISRFSCGADPDLPLFPTLFPLGSGPCGANPHHPIIPNSCFSQPVFFGMRTLRS